jgi:hypothetical protein
MYFDTELNKRQTASQLKRRGLMKPEINLANLGVIELVTDHGMDTDLYAAVETGTVEIIDGKAYAVYKKKNRVSNPDAGFDIRRKMKDKVNARRDEIFTSGIKIMVDTHPYILQTRGVNDLFNWSELKRTAAEMAEGTMVKVRTEDDKVLDLSAEDICTVLDAYMQYRSRVMEASWQLKDQIRDAATDDDAFSVYEAGIDTVWPDDTAITL